jgi:hypothetical protein
MKTEPLRLRELASWYREFAERTGNLTIWEARLRTAEDLDAQAEAIDRAGQPARTSNQITGGVYVRRARASHPWASLCNLGAGRSSSRSKPSSLVAGGPRSRERVVGVLGDSTRVKSRPRKKA